MAPSTKIEFRHRRIRDLDDITDFVGILFPGNRNQQHAAARVLLLLKASREPVRSFHAMEAQFSISRRTLERTRAKLANLGLIENVSPLSKRAHGQPGWRLSGRMSTALRMLADKIEGWLDDKRPERAEKDEKLAGLLWSDGENTKPRTAWQQATHGLKRH